MWLRSTIVIAVAGSLSCATVGTRSSVLGRPVKVALNDGGKDVKGELIAVGDDRIWIRDASGVLELPVSAVQSVHVARHSFSGGKALRWAAIGGLASAGALTAACQSVEGNEVGGCATAGLLVGGLIVGASALAVPSINASRWQSLYSPKPEALRPYARFPQGLPEGVDPFTLDPPPDEP